MWLALGKGLSWQTCCKLLIRVDNGIKAVCGLWLAFALLVRWIHSGAKFSVGILGSGFQLVHDLGYLAFLVGLCLDLKAFFNTMGLWGICPNGPLPLPHHWRKKMAYCPKVRTCTFSKWVLHWKEAYVVFECLACNLLQTSPLKLCFEKLRFF
jgi:hypothetical protein